MATDVDNVEGLLELRGRTENSYDSALLQAAATELSTLRKLHAIDSAEDAGASA